MPLRFVESPRAHALARTHHRHRHHRRDGRSSRHRVLSSAAAAPVFHAGKAGNRGSCRSGISVVSQHRTGADLFHSDRLERLHAALLPPIPIKPWTISSTAETVLIVCGAASLIIPLVIPPHLAARIFFLVWVGFALLLDPINRRLSLPSFLGDFSEGFARRFWGFLLAGWICGWLWEFWNYWAAAKWNYTLPMFQNLKLFEMPAPGYLGFVPFAVECLRCTSPPRGWLAG
jgi:hypothetical protein